MQHQQFERDPAHLELIASLLARRNFIALSYWRRRVAELTEEQYLIPSGALRVTRLLGLPDDIECATKRLESASPLGAAPVQLPPASSRSRL